MTNTITLPRSVVEQALEHLTCPVDEPVREAFRAALDQPQVNSPEIPEGWRLVPVEPTEAMLHAGNSAIENWGVDANGSSTYRAMLAAAPQPPVVEQTQVEQEPLTEYEIKDILKPLTLTVPYRWREIVKAIERAHGIGGEA